MKKFLKSIPMKLWAILCALVLLTFFSNDFGLVDIQKTALVLAAGIDRNENEFTLTAQIAVPKGTDRTTGGTSGVEIEGTGTTVSDCLADLYGKTGWVPKLIFCDLVVLGETVVAEDAFDCLDYFCATNTCRTPACWQPAKAAPKICSPRPAPSTTLPPLPLKNCFRTRRQSRDRS